MRINKMKHPILFLIFLVYLFQTMVCTNACVKKRLTIDVINFLPASPHDLVVHCASKNDDLGYRTIPRGKGFKFSFCPSIFGNTLFFCHLWWFNKEKAFDVYSENISTCGATENCYYVAKPDGIYYSDYNSGESLVKIHDWNIHK